jgi:hypothetical protein
MAYATIDDLEARYGEVPSELSDRVDALLEDAATILDAQVVVDISDQQQLARLRLVSCSMVNRALQAAESDAYGISQASMTAGSYTQSMSYANPSGDLYLTGTEKRMLGIGTGYILSLRAGSGRDCR